MNEIYGIPAKYTSDGDGNLPKARIRVTIPNDETYSRLETLHNREASQGLYSDQWEEFVRPFQTADDEKGRLTLEIDKFVLESAQRLNRERYQIAESNERAILFLYGEQAKVYGFQLRTFDGGENIQGQDTEWARQLEDFYRRFRATTIADYQLGFSVSYNYKTFHGAWLNFDVVESGEADTLVGVTFQMFITGEERATYTLGKKPRRE